MGGSLWERVVSDIGLQVKEILGFHLGIEGSHLADDTRLQDLGADSLDVVEIVMSCEERFGVTIPNREATSLVTIGDAVRCVEAQLATLAADRPASRGLGLRAVLAAK